MMNATTRVQSQPAYTAPLARAQFWSLQTFCLFVLTVLVFLSAFSVVYMRDYQRELVTNFHGLQMTYDAMLTQRSQLLLEQASFSTQTRIQDVAIQKLGMIFPQQETMVTLD